MSYKKITVKTYTPASFEGSGGSGFYSETGTSNPIGHDETWGGGYARVSAVTLAYSDKELYAFWKFSIPSSDIPQNAVIESVSCVVKGGSNAPACSIGGALFASPLTSAAKTQKRDMTDNGGTGVVVIGGGRWNRSELINGIYIGLYGTIGYTWARRYFDFYGASLIVTYSMQEGLSDGEVYTNYKNNWIRTSKVYFKQNGQWTNITNKETLNKHISNKLLFINSDGFIPNRVNYNCEFNGLPGEKNNEGATLLFDAYNGDVDITFVKEKQGICFWGDGLNGQKFYYQEAHIYENGVEKYPDISHYHNGKVGFYVSRDYEPESWYSLCNGNEVRWLNGEYCADAAGNPLDHACQINTSSSIGSDIEFPVRIVIKGLRFK